MLFRNLRIGTRLTIGFGLILVVLMAVAVAGTWLGKKSRENPAAGMEGVTTKQGVASDMRALALEQAGLMRSLALRMNVNDMQADEGRVKKVSAQYDEARRKMEALTLSADERAILETLKRFDQALDAPFNQVLTLARQ